MVGKLFRDFLDYTIPVVSIVKGERITRIIDRVLGGVDGRVLWLPFFCVSTNLGPIARRVHARQLAAVVPEHPPIVALATLVTYPAVMVVIAARSFVQRDIAGT
jgi:hypothetical protein